MGRSKLDGAGAYFSRPFPAQKNRGYFMEIHPFTQGEEEELARIVLELRDALGMPDLSTADVADNLPDPKAQPGEEGIT